MHLRSMSIFIFISSIFICSPSVVSDDLVGNSFFFRCFFPFAVSVYCFFVFFKFGGVCSIFCLFVLLSGRTGCGVVVVCLTFFAIVVKKGFGGSGRRSLSTDENEKVVVQFINVRLYPMPCDAFVLHYVAVCFCFFNSFVCLIT